jgi:hypothetical protein
VHLKDGTVLKQRCEVMRGEPGKPHDPRDLERKFHELTAPAIGKPGALKLYEGLMELERVPDVRALTLDAGL